MFCFSFCKRFTRPISQHLGKLEMPGRHNKCSEMSEGFRHGCLVNSCKIYSCYCLLGRKSLLMCTKVYTETVSCIEIQKNETVNYSSTVILSPYHQSACTSNKNGIRQSMWSLQVTDHLVLMSIILLVTYPNSLTKKVNKFLRSFQILINYSLQISQYYFKKLSRLVNLGIISAV